MATVNLGRIKPVFRGAYSGSTAYVVDDIVTHGNESFICIQAHGAGTQATSQGSYWTKLAAKGTDGTDVGTTITTQGDILYRDGSGLQRLAKGTAGQALKMNSSANAPEWGTISSDFVKISSGTLGSGTANWSIDGHFSSTYKDYKIFVRQLATADNGHTMYARLNTGGSANTGSHYSWSQTNYYSSSQNHQGNNSQNMFRVHQNSNNITHPGVEEFLIFDPLNTGRSTSMIYQGHGSDGTGGATNGSHGGVTFRQDTAVTGITIFSSNGGNVLAGAEYLVYGMKG